MHMLTTPALAARSSQLIGHTGVIEATESPPLIREQFSPLGGFTNPFLEASAQHAHPNLLRTPQSKFNNIWSTGTPTIYSASHLPLRHLHSTPPAASSGVFSCPRSPDSFALACYPPITTLSVSPLPSSSRSPRRAAFATPDHSGTLVASPLLLTSCVKSLNKSSPFAPSMTPFELFEVAGPPSLCYPQTSPVVRRSLGDVTPVYNHRDNAIGHSDITQPPLGYLREENVISEVKDQSSPSLSLDHRELGTPFLQKLRRRPISPQNQALVPLSDILGSTMLPLASPFTLKSVAAQESCVQSSSVTPPPAEHISMPGSENHSQSCTWHEPLFRRTIPVSTFSSPLSELSSIPSSPSPIPLDLKVVFEEEDRKYRMKTRSKPMSMPLKSPTAPRKRKLKNHVKYVKAHPISATPDDTASDKDTSPPRKRPKTLNLPTSPPLRAARWIMSKGAGPGTFSANARSRKTDLTSNSNASEKPTSPLPQIHAHVPQSPSTESVLQRNLPQSIPINNCFPNFYRKFPVSSFFYPNGAKHSVLIEGKIPAPPKASHVNIPRGAYDLYTPRFTRGVGYNKQGLCPICFESVKRGGADSQEWLSMKFSAYKCYHMQYFHGISATTGGPFSPPIDFRTNSRTHVRKHEKSEVLEGKCHNCLKWAPVEGVRIGTVNVKELFWWKHAAICHKDSKILEDTDVFIEDDVFHRLKTYEASLSGTDNSVTK